jgi:ComEC/Rec2-related protein
MNPLYLLPYTLFFLSLFLLHKLYTKQTAKPINLLPLVGALAVGIFLQHTQSKKIIIIAIAILLLLTLTRLKRFSKYTLCFFIIGVISLTLQKQLYHETITQIYNTTLIATVLDKKFLYNSFYKQAYTLETEDCKKIMLYTKNKSIPLGAWIKIKNPNIHNPKPNSSFYLYNMKEGVSGTIFLKPLSRITILPRPREWRAATRAKFLKQLQKKIPPKTFSLFSSLFLGNKSGNKPLKNNKFKYWGIMHHLARSGLHIALFIMILAALLSMIPLPIKIPICAICCIIYTILSWPSTPFVRAILALLIIQTGKILYKQTNILYTLIIITIATLTITPAQLFFLDFQLSFAIAISLTATFTTGSTPLDRSNAHS